MKAIANDESNDLQDDRNSSQQRILRIVLPWTHIEKLDVDQKVLSSRWIFKMKEDTRYRARLVTREYGIDFTETFSPVVNISSIRILLAIAAQRQLFVNKFEKARQRECCLTLNLIVF